MQIMNCILQRRGDNDYKLPHMNKEQLWRERRLPKVIEVDREARIACRGPKCLIELQRQLVPLFMESQ